MSPKYRSHRVWRSSRAADAAQGRHIGISAEVRLSLSSCPFSGVVICLASQVKCRRAVAPAIATPCRRARHGLSYHRAEVDRPRRAQYGAIIIQASSMMNADATALSWPSARHFGVSMSHWPSNRKRYWLDARLLDWKSKHDYADAPDQARMIIKYQVVFVSLCRNSQGVSVGQ